MSVFVPTTQEERSHVVRLTPPVGPVRPRDVIVEFVDDRAWYVASPEEYERRRRIIKGVSEARYRLVQS